MKLKVNAAALSEMLESVMGSERLLEALGVQSEDDLHSLGSGAYARAFLTPSGKVLKLTTDWGDAAVARWIMEHGGVVTMSGELLAVSPAVVKGLVPVYGVFRLPDPLHSLSVGHDGKTVYAIVVDQVSPLGDVYDLMVLKERIERLREEARTSEVVRGFLDTAEMELEQAKHVIPEGVGREELEQLSHATNALARAISHIQQGLVPPGDLLKEAMFVADDQYDIDEVGMLYLYDLVHGWEFMDSRGFGTTDLHTGNVGWDSEGNAVILDFGLSTSQSSEEPPEMSMAENPKIVGFSSLQPKSGLKFNPRPSHHRLRELVPNQATLSMRDRDELLRRVRELDALEERALRAYEARDYALAERIDAEYAQRADELEGLAAELMEDLVEEDVEPGEWNKHPMGPGHTPGPEGATDLTAELASLYDEYLNDTSPHSRFESPEHFRSTPFPLRTREDVLAYLTLHTIEAAHGRPVDVVDKDLLVSAAKDAHERRAELRGRIKSMKPNPSTSIDEVFDEAFDRIEDTFPDMGTVEFWEDPAAGADNGAGADRQFAYCKDGNPIAIAFARKATTLGREQLVGLMRHEFGHALEYRYGVAELERRLGVRLPDKVERRADAIAEAVWREPVVYDERFIQCVGKNPGVRPRPAHLPDERAVLRANPARSDGAVSIGEREDAYVVFDWIPSDAPAGYEGVAPVEKGIGGYLIAELVDSREEPHRRLVVDYIEVDEPYRRSGVSTRLYQEALAYARRHGATLISDTRRTLGAEMFWQKMLDEGVAEIRGEDPVRRWDGEVLDYRVTYYVMKEEAPEVLP